MSKIDDYNKAKGRYESFAQYAKNAQNPSQCDKLGCVIEISDTYIGFYGSSSCGAWDGGLTEAVRNWFEHHVRAAIIAVAEQAKDDMQKAAIAAQDEAREILNITQKE